MSTIPIFTGNDRDAGVVEEICGYLTEAPHAVTSYSQALGLGRHALSLKCYAG